MRQLKEAVVATVNQSPGAFFKKDPALSAMVQMGFLLVWLDPLAADTHPVRAGVSLLCLPAGLVRLSIGDCPVHRIALFPYFAVGYWLRGDFYRPLVCGWMSVWLLQDVAAKLPTPFKIILLVFSA